MADGAKAWGQTALSTRRSRDVVFSRSVAAALGQSGQSPCFREFSRLPDFAFSGYRLVLFRLDEFQDIEVADLAVGEKAVYRVLLIGENFEDGVELGEQ